MATYLQLLGVREHNPLGKITLAALILAIGTTLALLIAFFTISDTHQKLLVGYVLLFVSVIAPIPVALLVIWSRNIARTQDSAYGQTLAHWRYTPLQFYAPFLPYNVDEVYLHPQGVYFPAQNLRPRSFSSGLSDVVIIPGSPAMLVFYYIFKRRGQSGIVLSTQTKEITIPIPKGKEEEAEALVEYYRQRRGIPSDFMNDQWAIAWIMGGVMIAATLLGVVIVTPTEMTRIREDSQATSTAVAVRRATETFNLSESLQPVEAKLESRLQTWQTEADKLPVETWESIDGAELGFSSRDNITRVVYGRCDQDEAFYLFAIEDNPSKVTYYRDVAGAFAYSTGDHPYTCPPDYGQVSSVTPLVDGWYYVTLESDPVDVQILLTDYAGTLAMTEGTQAAATPTPRR